MTIKHKFFNHEVKITEVTVQGRLAIGGGGGGGGGASSGKNSRYQLLVSQARPSHSAAFSSFRINTRGEGLAHCLCPFGSMIS